MVYKEDLEHPDSKDALPFHVNNAKFRNKEKKSLTKSQKVTVKFKTGARILKIKTSDDLVSLLNYYPSEYYTKAPSIYNHTDKVNEYRMFPVHDLNNALTRERIEMLKKDYDGIHISDSLAKRYSDVQNQYHSGDYIIFNKDIIYSPKEKTQSIRKGTVGRRYKLSKKGLELANRTHKFYRVAMFARTLLRPNKLVSYCGKTDTYKHGGKDVTKYVNRIKNECNRIHRELELDVYNKFDFQNNASANFSSNVITMGYSTSINSYKFIRTLNALTFNKTALSKVTIEDVARATYLHELGHLKYNNRFRDDAVWDKLVDNSDYKEGKVSGKNISYYATTKSAIMSYQRERLLQEKLAWDFALKYDDSLSMKIMSTSALSTYQSYHNSLKKANSSFTRIGNTVFRYKKGEEI